MWRRRLLALIGFLSTFTLACSGAPRPSTCDTAAEVPTTPVVMVPGSTGSVLEDADTGKVVWGTGGALLGPFSRGHRIALPLTGPRAEGARIVPTAAIMRINLGLFGREIYRPLARQMQSCGYRVGNLRRPRPNDTFLFFPYDWRQGNTVSAADLVEHLQNLRELRGEERLHVHLVCQSAAVHLCRWALKYGAATLEEAEAGRAGLPPEIAVDRMLLVGPSSGGSLRNLRWLDRGRRYLGVIGRYWSPEVVFTFRSLYQDLPCSRSDLFLDAEGQVLAVDLHDPQAWLGHGWSVFRDPLRRRLDRRGRGRVFGDHEQRVAYLHQVLERSRRFHDLLARDAPGFGSTSYHVVHNVHEETPARAVLVEDRRGWRTFFTGDSWLEARPELARLASARGDGHATASSQLWLAPQERAAVVEALEVRDDHFEMIINPRAWSFMVRVLAGSQQ